MMTSAPPSTIVCFAVMAFVLAPVTTTLTAPAQAHQYSAGGPDCETNSGPWQGIAVGRSYSLSIGNGFEIWHRRACFQSRAACSDWIRALGRNIPDVHEVITAYCKHRR